MIYALLLAACTSASDKDSAAAAADTAATDSGGADDTADTDTAGAPRCVVVTDIDETLTTDDLEFVYQVADPDHDPEMRPDANTLLNGVASRGYTVVYLTGRGEGLSLLDGTSARDATEAWLDFHGFPWDDANVFLADTNFGLSGEEAHTYKTGVLTALAADGWPLEWGFGNAEADIEAYQDAGIPDTQIFLVGDLAGTMAVGAIPNEDAYSAFTGPFLEALPDCG
jgi:phosphatidate phosphatase PAH1